MSESDHKRPSRDLVVPVPPEAVEGSIATFLNDHPLYSGWTLNYEEPPHYVTFPGTILRRCDICDAEPTWKTTSASDDEWDGTLKFGQIVAYRCTHCERNRLVVWLVTKVEEAPGKAPQRAGFPHSEVASVTMWKFGQSPEPSDRPDPRVANALSTEGRGLYKKGLRSLAHGYGLGALVYFRRVVEGATHEILDLVERAAEAQGDAETLSRIADARAVQAMEDKLRMAADALPPSLRPGGANPLAALFQQYSRGVHQLSEDECVLVATRMRFSLEYVFKNLKGQIDEAAKFRDEITTWADRAAQPERGG